MTDKASCSECPSMFELIPPADKSYRNPREKPTSDDYIKRIYECEEGHRNTIYWEKDAKTVVVSSSYRSEAMKEKDFWDKF